MIDNTVSCVVLSLIDGGETCLEKVHIKLCLPLMKKTPYKRQRRNIRRRIVMLSGRKSYSWRQKGLKTKTLVNTSICPARLSASGESVFSNSAWKVSKSNPGEDDLAVFPPEIVMEIKALACELPAERRLPFSRLSHAEIAREAVNSGLVASISGNTVWRWLSADAIKPWSYRSWIFPRDPLFAEKAGLVLDLYQGVWVGEPLGPNDYVISADEKTSIQARGRLHPDAPPGPHRARRVEFEYKRGGALAYMAAWDVHRAKLFGLCVGKTGIKSFRLLVKLVMRQEPYRSARRVFWITDNGSSHRGDSSIQRLSKWYPNAIQIHTPVHASWLNQIEIYFSVVQRKVLTPNDFPNLAALENQLLAFQEHYEKIAKPFQWKFTKEDLKNILFKVPHHNPKPLKELIAA